MTISLGCDHGGLELKNELAVWLLDQGHQVKDFGTHDSASCDYPDYALPASMAVAIGECQYGVVVCTTGIGVSMVANKVEGVRCALCTNADMAHLTRQHNDANVLALGAKYVDSDQAKQILEVFLNTQFEGGRHTKRVDKIHLANKE